MQSPGRPVNMHSASPVPSPLPAGLRGVLIELVSDRGLDAFLKHLPRATSHALPCALGGLFPRTSGPLPSDIIS